MIYWCVYNLNIARMPQYHNTTGNLEPHWITSRTRGLLQYRISVHLKLKSHKISVTQNIHFSCQIVLEICAEHGSDTTVLCTKFQNDLTTKQSDICKRVFTRFLSKMHFGRIFYIVTVPIFLKDQLHQHRHKIAIYIPAFLFARYHGF